MATLQSHFSFSTGLSVLYAAAGAMVLDVPLEIVLLAAVVVVITGVLPNIDEGKSGPAQEFGGLIAAIIPLVCFQLFPALGNAGVSRVALVVVGGYFVSQLVVVRTLQGLTTHRGVLHSIPAAIICCELVFLIFSDLTMFQRGYLTGAAFSGFFAHLVMDGYGNLDLVGRAMGRGVEKQAPALKLTGNTWLSTLAMYSCMFVLGWFVVQDIYPGFHFEAGFRY